MLFAGKLGTVTKDVHPLNIEPASNADEGKVGADCNDVQPPNIPRQSIIFAFNPVISGACTNCLHPPNNEKRSIV